MLEWFKADVIAFVADVITTGSLFQFEFYVVN